MALSLLCHLRGLCYDSVAAGTEAMTLLWLAAYDSSPLPVLGLPEVHPI